MLDNSKGRGGCTYTVTFYTCIVHVTGPAWLVSKAIALRLSCTHEEVLSIENGAPAKATILVQQWNDVGFADDWEKELTQLFGQKPFKIQYGNLTYLGASAPL